MPAGETTFEVLRKHGKLEDYTVNVEMGSLVPIGEGKDNA